MGFIALFQVDFTDQLIYESKCCRMTTLSLYLVLICMIDIYLPGVLTGCGKQKIGAAVNLGAFYLLGIPMAVLLAFIFHLNGMVP